MLEDDGYINGSVVLFTVPADVLDQVNLLLVISSYNSLITSDGETLAEQT